MVQQITKYKFKGKEYNDLKEINTYLHDRIGQEVINKIFKNVDMRYKDIFKILDILCEPTTREILLECYTATIDFEHKGDTDNPTGTINILDL